MKNKVLTSVVLTLLAIVFTVALTFVTIEAPRVLNRFIRENSDVPDIHPVVVAFMVYLAILVLLSLPFLLLDIPGYVGWGGWS